jgi:hypothetical protein
MVRPEFPDQEVIGSMACLRSSFRKMATFCILHAIGL